MDIVVTGRHVAPPLVETSTPATTPPPASVALPVMVTAEPFDSAAPWDGDVIVDVGPALAEQPGVLQHGEAG